MKRTQFGINTELKASVTQLGNTKECLPNRMNQAEDRIQGLKNNESQKVLFKHYAHIKRPQMRAQTFIPSRTFNITDGKNKIIHDRTRLTQYQGTIAALHKGVEGKLQPKEARYPHKSTENR